MHRARRRRRFALASSPPADLPSPTASPSPPPFLGRRASSEPALAEPGAPPELSAEEEAEALARFATGGAIVGTCPEMCPPAERERRARDEDLDPFERDGGRRNATTPALAVKKFTRSTDNPVPSLFRTPAALRASMTHLLGLLRTHGRADFKAAYRFLWDRFRAIRTDITVQRLCDPLAVWLYECMARFHILAAHALCEDAQSVANPDGFNAHLNIDQLTKCLTSLFSMYAQCAREGRPCATEAEFRAYYLLLLLDAHGRHKPDPKAVADALRKQRPELAAQPPMRRYFRVAAAYRDGNWVAFFRHVVRTRCAVLC